MYRQQDKKRMIVFSLSYDSITVTIKNNNSEGMFEQWYLPAAEQSNTAVVGRATSIVSCTLNLGRDLSYIASPRGWNHATNPATAAHTFIIINQSFNSCNKAHTANKHFKKNIDKHSESPLTPALQIPSVIISTLYCLEKRPLNITNLHYSIY